MELTQHTKSKRITLYESDTLQIDAEYNEFFFILHLPKVTKFSKTVYLICVEKLASIKEFAKTIGYMSIYTAVQDKPTEKLVNKLGMKFKGSAEGYHVYEVELG